MQITRPVLIQPFSSFNLTILTTPTPLQANSNKNDLIDSFIISVDAAAANNVFFGDSSVTTTNGIEVVAGGGPINFVIRNQWQQYDLQNPLVQLSESMQCQSTVPIPIPFVVWDFSQIYGVAVANTNIRIMAFRSQFV